MGVIGPGFQSSLREIGGDSTLWAQAFTGTTEYDTCLAVIEKLQKIPAMHISHGHIRSKPTFLFNFLFLKIILTSQ